VTAPTEPVERRLKPEFAPNIAGRQHRPEVSRCNRLHVLTPNRVIRRDIAMQQARQLGQIEIRRWQVASPEIENGVVLCLASVVAIVFERPHVFVLDAFAAGSFTVRPSCIVPADTRAGALY
jgi:hypothetical protein